MHQSFLVAPALTVGLLLLAAPAVRAQLNTAVTPFTNRTLFQTGATNAGAPATNTVDFEDTTFTPDNPQSTGFIPTFTKAGFVTFNIGNNYSQEIIQGNNVGQGINKVYTTLAGDKNGVIADVTFAAGVFSLGFDFKNTANGPFSAGFVPQPFTFRLFSGATDLGTFTETTLPNGSTFSFAGFTSTLPITEVQVNSVGGSPNLDVVLDNFAVANPVPEPATTTVVLGAGLLGVALVRARRRGARQG